MDQAEPLRNIIKAGTVSVNKPQARVISVTSGKGGVGKSNTAINLAIQFRRQGLKVIILDADFGLANIEIMFGAIPTYNLYDLIYQGKNIREIITWAGISDAVLEFLVASGEILLVTTSEPTSITDAYSLLKALGRHPRFESESSEVKVIANRVAFLEDGETLYHKLNAVVSRYLEFPITYLGEIPEDHQLAKAVMQQTPVSLKAPGARSAQAYERIAAKLMDREAGQSRLKRGMEAFFSHILAGKNLD